MATPNAVAPSHRADRKEFLVASGLVRALAIPWLIALGIAAIYSIRFLYCLPFSGFTRLFNYETVTTLTSYFIYAGEPFSFPIGIIKHLTFPFEDANAGNVGALPLAAITFKAAGNFVPYFQTFDYFELVEILSCFVTAYFSQMILLTLGVRNLGWRVLGSLLTATSMLILGRSAWLQPFCVVAFPLFTGWIYGMQSTLLRQHWRWKQDALILSLFPAATLTDNYTLWGLLLATAVLVAREAFEAFFSELPASRNRLGRLLFFCAGGAAASLLFLYIIGMYPLPPMAGTFTSYDFGAGGRYHVADLFAPWIPIANNVYGFTAPSLPARLGFPLTTDILGSGQYEGVGYVGTPVVLMWIAILLVAIVSLTKCVLLRPLRASPKQMLVTIYSPWKKIALAALCVFIFSLGYELHILGKPFPGFSGMPAAWISDRLPALYNFRAPGRLASLFSIVIILEAIRRLATWQEIWLHSQRALLRHVHWILIAGLALLHLIEVAPLLRPVPAQPLLPIGAIYTKQDIDELRRLAVGHNVVLVAPSVLAVDTKWTTSAFSMVYYMGLRSNLYYVARNIQTHADLIGDDINRILAGDWDTLSKTYGNVIFAIPDKEAGPLRKRMSDRYFESVVGPMSIWVKR